MAIRKTLSDRGVAALRPMASRYAMPDPELRGHYVRVTPNGQKSFVAVARAPSGKQIWTTIGAASVFSIDDARGEAREVIKRVRAGLPPIQAKADSFADVAAIWIRRHVEKTEPDRQPASKRTKRRRARDDEPKVPLRSRREILRMLNSHILPAWRDREFISIKRSDVTKLMDDVEDKHGARAADYVLYVFASIANWHAARVDDYSSPIIRGMRRQSTKEQARDRTLDDAEIRLIWKEAESAGAFGAIVRLLLLTAQRRTKVAEMRWSEISIAGAWTIPKEPREKENAGLLLLPEVALAIIRAQPRIGTNPYIFPGRRTDGPFKGFGEAKAAFDAKLPANTPGWTLHDLRRTARSLMSRAGVRPDIAERVLGHAIVGVGGTYDRFSYRDEKAEAVRCLAALIESIVVPPASNVRRLRKAAR